MSKRSKKKLTKFRLKVSELKLLARLITMEGKNTGGTTGKTAALFEEIMAEVKGHALVGRTTNANGQVYEDINFKVEVLQPGKFWCGDTPRFKQLISRITTNEGNAVVTCGAVILVKTSKGPDIRMKNVEPDMIGTVEMADEYANSCVTNDEIPKFADEIPEVKITLETRNLGEVVKDAEIMNLETTSYPFKIIDVPETSEHALEIKTADDQDGVRRIFRENVEVLVALEEHPMTEYSIGVDSIVKAFDGEGPVDLFFSTGSALMVRRSCDQYTILVVMSPRLDDEELQEGFDGVEEGGDE